MYDIIAGNICSLLAFITDSISGTRKNPRAILGVQIISQFFYAAGSTILKGYSAVVQNVVAVFRNLLAMSGRKIAWLEWLLIAAAVGLGLYFNNRGWLGILPVVGNLEYTLCVFRFSGEERKLKIAFIINMIVYTAFNITILNIVGAVTNFTVAVITFISLRRGSTGDNTETEQTKENP